MTGAISGFLHELGGFIMFLHRVSTIARRTKGNLRAIYGQIVYVSYRSLSTVLFAGLFVGAILVIQFNSMLVQYDAQVLIGGLNTSAVVREVGPLIISFLLAGKIGAFTAAELGTMRVTEQIDAVQCLGTDPLQYLVVPRFVAIVISSVLLLMMGLVVSVVGAMIVASAACGVNPWEFMASIPQFTDGWTVFCGFFKSLIYGHIVAGVACYKGFTASGGARGVGKAVTQSAVYTNLYIVIANYIISDLLNAAYEVGKPVMERLF
ncbi:MAG: ABC transporter permease [Bdellovibrionales bacterium]|nr:ABC transporter permease [Bdellovibrionales bacterium]